ncbi:methyltransferase domain-containing protein [Streptomyces sp. NPDC057806]|uniref:methyltransferase domain-containing protein n=1 Tax=Streptomyces sp. NPDC057806 TaxID=3346255 RepID=UPI0036B6F7C2
MTFSGLDEGRSELGRSLIKRKVLTSDWIPSFAAVPRADFLPELMWPYDMGSGTTVAVDRRLEPGVWGSYANGDMPIVTQWDDRAGEELGKVPTSSVSMPSVVFRMLRDLDVQPGQRVLEIGTGTGWNAALLAHRLGPSNVVSMEIDATVAAAARDRLARRSLPLQVLSRDGVAGDEPGAPYDRIIATAGLRSVPPAWIAQVRPGGLIMAPWGTHYSNQDALVRLRGAEDGRSASGVFMGPVEFMKLRSHRLPFAGHDHYVPDGVSSADRSTTTLKEKELLGDDQFAVTSFAVGLRVRDCYRQVAAPRQGSRPVWFYGLGDRSWACVMLRDSDAEVQVWQSGPRRLWDEVSAALDWWRETGQPGYDRFGLTVTQHGQQVWLDEPMNAWDI